MIKDSHESTIGQVKSEQAYYRNLLDELQKFILNPSSAGHSPNKMQIFIAD